MRSAGLFALVMLLWSCAQTQTMVHQPTLTSGGAIELGAVYSPDEEIDNVESPESEKVSSGDKTGYSALFQFANAYWRVDAAPIPGSWFGFAWTKSADKFSWSPAFEISGSPSGTQEETKDGFLNDEDGNRYLYEVKTKSSGIGLALPQVWEVYPVRRFAIYFAAVPGMINSSKKTEVEMVFERDRRIVLADPELSAEFQDIQTYETRNDVSKTQWMMPLMVGVRAQVGPVHVRLQYADRRIDSIKDFESSYKQLFVASMGYVMGGQLSRSRSFNSRSQPARSNAERGIAPPAPKLTPPKGKSDPSIQKK